MLVEKVIWMSSWRWYLVPFSNCDSKPRIIDIVQKMVDNEEVEYYKAFFNESKAQKMRHRNEKNTCRHSRELTECCRNVT
ncbi:unnamed protein product [Phaedon cochleariae]|uniref:DNAJC9 HTH domain-containing protein n=1 Tax=Phaedon cochleariae TaxID=80249 RepID=A0A9N9S9W4_PHACE|nr:unnamed protein product [Phaedon cochleariae]